MKSSLRRVSNDFWKEVERIYKKNKGMISKTAITRQIAKQIRSANRRQPRFVIDYWPLSNKKVKVY